MTKNPYASKWFVKRNLRKKIKEKGLRNQRGNKSKKEIFNIIKL